MVRTRMCCIAVFGLHLIDPTVVQEGQTSREIVGALVANLV